MSRHVTLLKRALWANIAFSTVSAVVFLTAAAPLGAFIGCAAGQVAGTGVNLFVFAGLMLLVVTRPAPLPGWALGLAVVVAAMDVLWVVATPFSIAPFSAGGRGVFVAIAVVVAVLAALQIRALVGIFGERRRAAGRVAAA